MDVSHPVTPGHLSQRLRQALALRDGAPPPWQGRFHVFGLPFDYRTDTGALIDASLGAPGDQVRATGNRCM